MQVTKILKKDRLDRYYKMRLLVGGMSSFDRVFFDANYLALLSPDEVVAVGAHEFTHLNRRHGIKKFCRLIMPALMTGVVIGSLVFFNFSHINALLLVNFGKTTSSLLAAILSSFLAYVGCLYVNAKWFRQQEKTCDLSAVKISHGKAMISALIKLNNLRPRKKTRLEQLLPKLYPTFEERINYISSATNEKTRNPSEN